MSSAGEFYLVESDEGYAVVNDEGFFLDFTTICCKCGLIVDVVNGERTPSECNHNLAAIVGGETS